MTILSWIKRRTKSRYADDKAVDDFSRVARGQGLPLDYDRDKRLAEMLSSDEDPAGNFDEVAKLLGQSGKTPKL